PHDRTVKNGDRLAARPAVRALVQGKQGAVREDPYDFHDARLPFRAGSPSDPSSERGPIVIPRHRWGAACSPPAPRPPAGRFGTPSRGVEQPPDRPMPMATGDTRTVWHRDAKGLPECFGRSDRSRLILGDDIILQRPARELGSRLLLV